MNKIYISTAPSETPKTGDFDYAHLIVEQLNKNHSNAKHICSSTNTGDKIINQILGENRNQASPPVLHLILNANISSGISTGSSITPKNLQKFKQAGGKIIITAMEYAKYSISSNDTIKKKFDEYFNQADHIIFVDDIDRNSAINSSSTAINRSSDTQKKILNSAIIAVPNTVNIDPSKLQPLARRGDNILCFGIIRPYKGIETQAIDLAKELNDRGSNRKVIIAGSISEDNPKVFFDLLRTSYAFYESQINKIIQSANRNNKKAVSDLLDFYNNTLKSKTPDINIEFHFNVEEKDLHNIFNKCKYAINFHHKGVSPHFSGITNTILHGMKQYGLDGRMTPKYFRAGGKYQHAVKLSNNVSDIISDIEKLEQDPNLQQQCQDSINLFLRDHPITIDKIAVQHKSLYRSVLNNRTPNRIQTTHHSNRALRDNKARARGEGYDQNYKILISEDTLDKIISYKEFLEDHGIENAGKFLKKELQSKNLSTLTYEKFLDILLQTKKPYMCAESHLKGDGSDWNRYELQILGDISMSVPVEIYNNGAHRNQTDHASPIQGTLLYVPGALLNGCASDLYEVGKRGKLNDTKLYELYERRLLPLLMQANTDAGNKGKKAFITVPGLGCGYFAGDKFKGKLEEKLQKSLRRIIYQHGDKLKNIQAIYYDPHKTSNHIDGELTLKGINFITKSLTKGGKPQLCDPKEYGPEYQNCELYSMVAWDHISWPGNDFWEENNRVTDDGVKAASTDSNRQITGVKGTYNRLTGSYAPPTAYSDWSDVVKSKNLKLGTKNRILVVDKYGHVTNLNRYNNINNYQRETQNYDYKDYSEARIINNAHTSRRATSQTTQYRNQSSQTPNRENTTTPVNGNIRYLPAKEKNNHIEQYYKRKEQIAKPSKRTNKEPQKETSVEFFENYIRNLERHNFKLSDIDKLQEYGLIDHHIETDTGDEIPPIFYAIYNQCSSPYFKKLITAGARLDDSFQGLNILHIAIQKNQNKEIIKLILDNNNELINSVDNNGNTALHYAILGNCQNDVINTLLSYNPNLDIKNNQGASIKDCIPQSSSRIKSLFHTEEPKKEQPKTKETLAPRKMHLSEKTSGIGTVLGVGLFIAGIFTIPALMLAGIGISAIGVVGYIVSNDTQNTKHKNKTQEISKLETKEIRLQTNHVKKIESETLTMERSR